MSIAEEIVRLLTAKRDIKTAIENKGVTVSSSATLDEYSTYIDSIESSSAELTFYDASLTIPSGAKGGNTKGRPPVDPVDPPVEPGTHVTFYIGYDSNEQKVPTFLIMYDPNHMFTNQDHFVLYPNYSFLDTLYIGHVFYIQSLTDTLATIKYDSGVKVDTSNLLNFKAAPIYLNN